MSLPRSRVIRWSSKSKPPDTENVTGSQHTNKASVPEKEDAFWGRNNRCRSPEGIWNRNRNSSGTSSDRSPDRVKSYMKMKPTQNGSKESTRKRSEIDADNEKNEETTDEKQHSESDSGVGRESPTHHPEDAVGDWLRGNAPSPDFMDTSIRFLIQNYASRSHVYPTGGVLDDDPTAEAQEYVSERSNEKYELGNLNCRFENYIDHVRKLESENIALLAELKTYQEKYMSISMHLKIRHQTEIHECRILGSDSKKDVERLTVQQRALQAERDEWQKR